MTKTQREQMIEKVDIIVKVLRVCLHLLQVQVREEKIEVDFVEAFTTPEVDITENQKESLMNVNDELIKERFHELVQPNRVKREQGLRDEGRKLDGQKYFLRNYRRGKQRYINPEKRKGSDHGQSGQVLSKEGNHNHRTDEEVLRYCPDPGGGMLNFDTPCIWHKEC